jgi:sulfonate transport system substrate-binding protein
MKNFKLLSTSLILGLIGSYAHAVIPNTLKLDYAYYAPTSLVVKEQKLLEKALPKTEIK